MDGGHNEIALKGKNHYSIEDGRLSGSKRYKKSSKAIPWGDHRITRSYVVT